MSEGIRAIFDEKNYNKVRGSWVNVLFDSKLWMSFIEDLLIYIKLVHPHIVLSIFLIKMENALRLAQLMVKILPKSIEPAVTFTNDNKYNQDYRSILRLIVALQYSIIDFSGRLFPKYRVYNEIRD